MICSSCGTESPPGRKFCGTCGAPLALICPSCGTSNDSSMRFCGECGTSLTDPSLTRPERVSTGPTRQPAAAERRLVSVLFADLVGFTTLSESRDAEEVRELLSRYFDTCRTLIARYGGVVEKFIGDAVMAVWGAPVATEDDAERAVRAALELTDAVTALGRDIEAPDLRARAGVLTGEAAVNLGAEGQGMVAGDLVNTASRVQSLAPTGSVLVGESTWRATEGSIVYEEAGPFELRGKSEPVQLWRALRVVGARGGALRSAGLEAPFVGRDGELRLIKELFHSSAEEGRAHLASVLGIAGLGKSRLLWEFFKYVDGLVDVTYWHRGRCLAYGEGVTYWALAEMVKSHAHILEDEDPATALVKLRKSVQEHLPDPEEQRWVEPRLAHLLGLEERAAQEREELFSAWRLFFERLADQRVTVLVFEDLHWADPSLVDFIEYLLDWSRNNRIFVLTLARPELMDRFPSWGAGARNFTSISLEPLDDRAMQQMLASLVPGLPDELRARILERAEGIPLYAVETVRMLLDRNLLAREGSVYRLTGPIETLEVPESLHALIAARLDGLLAEERLLIQDGSVLGRTFTKGALAAVMGRPAEDLKPLLASLVRKEVLQVQADPRSPERGQYGFLQDLVRKIAYGTLSKKERKARHLSVTEYLRASGEEDEVIEVVASHYLAAYMAAPDASDADEIRAAARDALVKAGERAASLAASEEAKTYFERAAGLTEAPDEQASLLERAGTMALAAGGLDEARIHLEAAMVLYEAEGQPRPAARVSARLAEVDRAAGRLAEAIDRMEKAFAGLSTEEPDEDLATLAAELGRQHFFEGDLDAAGRWIEVALDVSEKLRLPEVLSQALNTKGLIAVWRGHPEEAAGLLKHALDVALEHDATSAALRAFVNLAEGFSRGDRYEEAIEYHERARSLARKVGNRFWEWVFLSESAYPLMQTGRWDEVLSSLTEIPRDQWVLADVVGFPLAVPEIHVHRGELDEARRGIELFERYEGSADLQERSVFAAAKAVVLIGEQRYPEALAAARFAFTEGARAYGPNHLMVKTGFVFAAEAASALGDTPALREVLGFAEGLSPGQSSPFVDAHAMRFRARLTVSMGDDPTAGFKTAIGMFREMSVPFWMAVTLLERGEWLVQQGRADEAEPVLAEVRTTFERLAARPWLERLEKASSIASLS